jgi:site-specific DNA recombinase
MKKALQAKDLTFTVLERAALYARVSGDDRGKEGRNLAGQLEMGREYAKEKGYQIIEELSEDDRGASGAEIDLPQLNQILDMGSRQEFDVLIVREIDRLSRNIGKQLFVEEELKKAGVRIEYVLGEYPDTPEGRLNKHIRASIAEYEREKIRERMVRGKRNKVKDNKVIKGKRPTYGLEFTQDGDGFVIVEETARIVRDIFRMYLSGMGTERIAIELNRLGVLTPQDGEQWYPSTVKVILRNRAYIGEWFFGRTKTQKINGKWIKTKNPEEHHLIVTIPSIIDHETFKAAQEQFKINGKMSKRNTKHEYLLGRRLTCQCGAAIVGHSQHKGRYQYYRCRATPVTHGYECNMKRIPVKQLDNKVWDELAEYIHDPKKLERALTDYQKEISQVMKPLQERLQTAEGLLEHWYGEWENTVASIRATKSEKAKALFNEELERIEAALEGLKNERAEIVDRIESQGMSDEQILTIVEFTQQMAEDWDEIGQDPIKRRGLIDLLDIRITLIVTPEGQRKGLLSGRLPGEPKEFCIDDNITRYTVRNAESLTFKLVIDL